ncbi:hypothetical protein M422DRAFT_257432 [Sphaerobolus stellatus SS14]|uniref:Uncharacterized protein n=1 Tax=Sphaerobolus stellatus (strain SS14) TaxID=990650 RepID=A0A0C9VPP9_SPHS4|nr:hypothetical protein M422DRAFT_257432 [Sphaerobolus stellatus SS14]
MVTSRSGSIWTATGPPLPLSSMQNLPPRWLHAVGKTEMRQVRVYYLDSNHILQEYCYTSGKGWYPGEVGNLGVQAAQNTKIAAVEYGDSNGGVHLRVYCQESGSNSIKEIANDGSWFRAATLPAAASGSSIAAVAYLWKSLELRVYCQTEDGSIKENALTDNSGWFVGEFSANAPRGASISAIGWSIPEDGGVELQVYWLNAQNTIVYSKNTGSWGSPQTVIGGLRAGLNFAAAEWDFGKRLRLYFQGPDKRVQELYNDGTDVWQPGSLQ